MSFIDICGIHDVFNIHVASFLSHHDLVALESVSSIVLSAVASEGSGAASWRTVCERDFPCRAEDSERLAPDYCTHEERFRSVKSQATWKRAYQKWFSFDRRVDGGVLAEHLLWSIDIWNRLRRRLQGMGLTQIIESLQPCPSKATFQKLTELSAPSSLKACYAVHGGQSVFGDRVNAQEFFNGLLGSFSVYNAYYSMRMAPAHLTGHVGTSSRPFVLGYSFGSPRRQLAMMTSKAEPEGELFLLDHDTDPSNESRRVLVGRGGLLEYLDGYLTCLESDLFGTAEILGPTTPSRGISLFPDAVTSRQVSVCVTRGVEIRASARWLPCIVDDEEDLNFAYSIRIRLVDTGSDDDIAECQLVGREWQFTDAGGNVRHVDGEGVIGKQPALFRREDGSSGFTDLGPAGDGETYENTVFTYQSQSGPVRGTSPGSTGGAGFRGSFTFMPGRIKRPRGPMFRATVAPVIFSIPSPFY